MQAVTALVLVSNSHKHEGQVSGYTTYDGVLLHTKSCRKKGTQGAGGTQKRGKDGGEQDVRRPEAKGVARPCISLFAESPVPV